jgi:hypothetical protein
MEYKKQLAAGTIQAAYKGLLEYCLRLKTHLGNKHPEYAISGSLYFGYMDMTYFSIVPKPFRDRKLKIAVVFLHEACRFEVWLAGVNKEVQTKYWKMIKENGWNTHPLVPDTKGADSILESVLNDNPDFNDLDALTDQLEAAIIKFIEDLESLFASKTLKEPSSFVS